MLNSTWAVLVWNADRLTINKRIGTSFCESLIKKIVKVLWPILSQFNFLLQIILKNLMNWVVVFWEEN